MVAPPRVWLVFYAVAVPRSEIVRDKIASLLDRLSAASGRDRRLDCEIARYLDDATSEQDDPPCYTASVDLCIELVARVLPDWHWHIGYGPKGVIPYAYLSNGNNRQEATAGTVPLALLIALFRALAVEAKS